MNSILSRIAPQAKRTAVKATVVVFDGGTRRRSATFGRGILAWKPACPVLCSEADSVWASINLNSAPAIDWDAAFEEVSRQELVENGYTAF